MKKALLLCLFCLPAFATVYVSSVPASATQPTPVSGDLHYRVLQQKGEGFRPIRRCVLVHGYGVGQPLIDLLVEGNTTGARFARVLAGLTLQTTVDVFATAVFGEGLIDSLRRQVCQETVLVLQESIQTNILEMTERTERFMRDKVCGNVPTYRGQKGCALIGHSKGGTVATQIVRRCMEAEKGKSMLGRVGCSRLAEVYTTGAGPMGLGISALALGVKVSKKGSVSDIFLSLFGSGRAPSEEEVSAIQGDYEPGVNNPAWMDIGPLAPLEQGATLFEKNRALVIDHAGWFRGQFAATVSAHRYLGDGVDTIGCGTPLRLLKPKEDPKPAALMVEDACRNFDLRVAPFHANNLREYFEAGVQEMERTSGLPLSDTFTWNRYQMSDGFVDAEISLSVCRRGNPRAVKGCGYFIPPTGINHYAMSGNAMEVTQDILRQLLH